MCWKPMEQVAACQFCASTSLRRARTIPRAALLAEYKKTCDITFPQRLIKSNFSFESLQAFECRACGTMTFIPTVIGDEAYYAFLSSNLGWYYDANRWEYTKTLEVFERNNVKTFLEIGCGDGHFLKVAREGGYVGTGSELNPRSIERLKAAGFDAMSETETRDHDRVFDALAMFQVLEHVDEPYAFLTSHLHHVRRGGLIILSTPVTPSCAASVARHVLSVPPHHQSMPTAAGHLSLAHRIGCVCEEMLFDLPSPPQVEFGIWKRIGWLLLYSKYANPLTRMMMGAARLLGHDWVKVGHTILVVLRRP